jgi:hypothetical protein
MTARRNPEVLIDAFLAEGTTDLPDRVFDAVRSDIHGTRQRVVLGPWREPTLLTPIRLAVAAAILVVAAGFTWSQIAPRPPDVGTQPSPAPSATPSASATVLAGSNQELARGRYGIDYGRAPGSEGSGPSIVFDIAASGWYDASESAVDFIYPDGVSYGPSFGVWNITTPAAEPCARYEAATPAPGPGIDDLLDALSGQDGIQAGPITPVTIDGYDGKFVDLTITADVTSCPEGFFTWGSAIDGRTAKATGEVDRVYALDVDGKRITFFTRVLADSAQEHIGQVRRIVESIDIQP